jgi:hypothetical protein
MSSRNCLALILLLTGCSSGGGGGGAVESAAITPAPSFSEPLGLQGLSLLPSDFIRISYDGPIGVGRTLHGAVTLSDGRVLIYGGMVSHAVFGTKYHHSSSIYDPASGEWTSGPLTAKQRNRPVMVGLAGGRVLILDGADSQVYDSAQNSFLLIPEEECQGGERFGAHAVLDGGEVFVAGSQKTFLFDPKAGALGCFRESGAMFQSRQGHSLTSLENGKVLVTGGGADLTAELFDPLSGALSGSGKLVTNRVYHSTVSLGDGRVLLAGGHGVDGAYLASAEVYDPSTGTFIAAENEMSIPRLIPYLVFVKKGFYRGKVLVIGGIPETKPENGISTIEIFDPETRRFSLLPRSLPGYLGGAAMAILSDGKILITGGQYGSNVSYVLDIYSEWSRTLVATGGDAPYTFDLLEGAAELEPHSGFLRLIEAEQNLVVEVTDGRGRKAQAEIRVVADD